MEVASESGDAYNDDEIESSSSVVEGGTGYTSARIYSPTTESRGQARDGRSSAIAAGGDTKSSFGISPPKRYVVGIIFFPMC